MKAGTRLDSKTSMNREEARYGAFSFFIGRLPGRGLP